MKINFCVPTRGKLGQIGDFVGETLRNSTLDTTRIVVGFDRDDDSIPEATKELPQHVKIAVSIADREDSLGAKYNRCAKHYLADIYIQGLDDVSMATMGWDQRLADLVASIPDRIVQVHIGKEPHGEPWPSFIAVTKEWVSEIGFFCPPYFPYWWNNTWLEEIGHYCGRIFRTELETRYPATIKDFRVGGRRHVAFFQDFFDSTRYARLEQAAQLMAKCDDTRWRKEQLFATWNEFTEHFYNRGALLRDPKAAAQFEGASEIDSSRHDRLKDRALQILGDS